MTAPEHASTVASFALRSGREIVVATSPSGIHLASYRRNGEIYSIAIPAVFAEDFAAAVSQASARLGQRLPGWQEAPAAAPSAAHGWNEEALRSAFEVEQ